MDTELSTAAKGVQASGVEHHPDDGTCKRQKRATLTTISTTAAPPENQHLPSSQAGASKQVNYDHLMRWEKPEEDVIVEWDNEGWGQSEEDEDEEADSGQDTMTEAEGDTHDLEYNNLDVEEMAIRQIHQRPRVGKIPLEEVIRIINESMEAFANQWSPSQIADMAAENKEQSLDPVQLWENAEALGRRNELVEKYNSDIQYFEAQLDKLSAEICDIPQNSEKQVRQHCRNLEVHVHNLEEAKWYLSIYELPAAESGDDSEVEESDAFAAQEPPQQHDVEVIDLSSSPESSNHEDDEEMIVDTEEPATARDLHLKNRANETLSSDMSTAPPNLGESNQAVLQFHLERDHNWSRAAAGKATDAAGTAPPYHEDDIEMVLEDAATIVANVPIARTLTLSRGTDAASESRIISSIEPIEAPVSPLTQSLPAPKLRKPQGSRPELASILTMSSWDMKELVAAKDRKRIVMKVMLDMSHQERETIRIRFRAVKKPNLLREISTCLDMLYRHEERMLGVLSSDLPKIKAIARFFLCWWLADNYMHKTPTEQQLYELTTNLHNCDDLEIFYDWVHFILHKNLSEEAFRNAHAPSQEEIIVISDDEAQPTTPASRKKQTRKQLQTRNLPQNDVIMLD